MQGPGVSGGTLEAGRRSSRRATGKLPEEWVLLVPRFYDRAGPGGPEPKCQDVRHGLGHERVLRPSSGGFPVVRTSGGWGLLVETLGGGLLAPWRMGCSQRFSQGCRRTAFLTVRRRVGRGAATRRPAFRPHRWTLALGCAAVAIATAVLCWCWSPSADGDLERHLRRGQTSRRLSQGCGLPQLVSVHMSGSWKRGSRRRLTMRLWRPARSKVLCGLSSGLVGIRSSDIGGRCQT